MSERARILVVDDEVQNLKAIERTLRPFFDVSSTASPTEALEWIEKGRFEVAISDQRMPEMPGSELLSNIAKKDPLITRVILTAFTEINEILEAINRAEIYRYVTKPWDNSELLVIVQGAVQHHRLLRQNLDLIRELKLKNESLLQKEKELLRMNQTLEHMVESRTKELKQANEKLNELAMTDPLTGLLNRRSFSARFEEEILRSTRYRHHLAVAMIDVDHFKQFNDQAGHIQGDLRLKEITQFLSQNLRKTDSLARYGGEEFIVMMPETTAFQAMEIWERLRQGVESLFAITRPRLTISVGICGYPEDGDSAALLVQVADKALYSAKASRNCVIAASKNNGEILSS